MSYYMYMYACWALVEIFMLDVDIVQLNICNGTFNYDNYSNLLIDYGKYIP